MLRRSPARAVCAGRVAGVRYPHRCSLLSVQHARWTNLLVLMQCLEANGYLGWEARVAWFDGVVTSGRLAAMMTGAPIDALFAAHVEHRLGLPRRWMDRDHAGEDWSARLLSQTIDSIRS